jgi:hypothetical protein
MKKRLFTALSVVALGGGLLTGCSTNTEKSEAELTSMLLEPSGVAGDAQVSSEESDLALFLFVGGMGEFPGCEKSADLMKDIESLPIVARNSVTFSSNTTGSFNEWVLDAKSESDADALVGTLSKEFYPDECALNIFEVSENQPLAEPFNDDIPGHIWLHAGAFGAPTVRTTAVTNVGRYVLFVDTTTRSEDSAGDTFDSEQAGAAIASAVYKFRGEEK